MVSDASCCAGVVDLYLTQERGLKMIKKIGVVVGLATVFFLARPWKLEAG